jgi:hypothetical protein
MGDDIRKRLEEERQERMEQATESITRFMAESQRESERRAALSPEQPLEEDGSQLRRELDSDTGMMVLLERSRSLRAGISDLCTGCGQCTMVWENKALLPPLVL